MEKVTLDEIKNIIKENKNVFSQKVKNKLKSTGMSEKDASDLINNNNDDVENSYNEKENEVKTAVKLQQKLKKEDINRLVKQLVKESKKG